MPDIHNLDELAEYAQRQVERIQRMHRDLAEQVGEGRSPRGMVRARTGPGGELKELRIDPETLRGELMAAVRAQIGPVAAFKDVDIVAALPKTRSGKILRKTMRAIAEGRDEPVPSTIKDLTVLDALRPVLSPRS